MSQTNLTNSSQNGVPEDQVTLYGTIVMGFMSVADIFANTFLLYILLSRMKVKRYSNILFASVALSDLMVALMAMPSEILMIWAGKVSIEFPPWANQLIIWIGYSTTSVSLYVLVFLTLHRLQLLTCPLKTSEKLSRPRMAILVGEWLGVYMTVGVFSLTKALIGEMPISVELLFEILVSLVPMVLVVVLNTWTIFALRQKANKNSALERRKSSLSANRRDAKAIVCLISISFVTTLSQIFLLNIYTLSILKVRPNILIEWISRWLSYINACLDPLIVFWFHEAVQAECRKWFSDFRTCLQRHS